ncbi:MAG: CDP-alcohol phosphatidyltransferase [Deltaproteobacteria bacterium ADurb.Bin510]|nr:MAG: CDP-alcohol phosphatidyltransferase [Deltaproteobacteria bacterium ADurb.Bin510]
MSKHKNPRRKIIRRRSVPFLPNFITTMSLFSGFYSIFYAIKGRFVTAGLLILLASLIDGMDGRVARATNSTSAFGKEYDSLSDVIAFGVAPALLAYLWKLNHFQNFGFLTCCLFAACGALRLARFNSDTADDHMSTFTGLPIPMAAATVISMVFLDQLVILDRISINLSVWFVLAMVYLSAFLMVSTIKYPSFKRLEYLKTHTFQMLVAGLLFIYVLAQEPVIMFAVMVMGFIAFGLIWNLIRVLRHTAADESEIGGVNHEVSQRENPNI